VGVGLHQRCRFGHVQLCQQLEDALVRLRRLVGMTPDWQDLWTFLPDGLKGRLLTRSAVASTFAASLEMAKEGKVAIRQTATFGPIFLQGRRDAPMTESLNSVTEIETNKSKSTTEPEE